MTDRRESGFDTEAGYAAAIDTVLAVTRQDVCAFDRDLVRMELESPARCEVLGRILASGRDSRLRVVLHDPGPLERHSPRLMKLLQHQSDRVEVRQTPKRLRHVADCFILGDARSGVVRFHAQHARGKCLIDDAEGIRPWQERFEELWEAATPCLAPTRLGL